MNVREETLERFRRDIAEHTMEVRLEQELYRHITFSRNGSSCYSFSLITWPGYLCIAGDCGTFTFSRVRDMFEFFRMSEADLARNGGELRINPHYWQEKLQAGSCGGRAISEEFSPEKFRKIVMRHYENWAEDCDDAELKAEVLQELEDEILAHECHEGEAFPAVNNYSGDHVSFEDFFEHDFTEYKSHYIWCLYAIVWGIQQWDKAKAESAEKTEAA